MKVLQIAPVIPPYPAGMANTAGEIWKAVRQAGVEADLVSAFGASTVSGLKHWRFPGLGLLAVTPALSRLIGGYDLVHLHYPCYGNALMVARGLSKFKKPLVVSYHMDTVGRGLRRPAFWFHRRFLAPRFLRRAAAIAVSSRDYAEHSLLAAHPELLAKAVEVPFGIDAERFSPAAKEPGRNILFVGGLDEQHYFKGLDVLLAALVKLPGAKLTVVGSGNLVKHYARRAYDLKIDERVTFAGKVPDAELPDYYRAADVFCLPSLDRSEAYGLVALEAQACGVPAVVSDIPGVRTAIKAGETGLLVKPGSVEELANALKRILDDQQLTTKFQNNAREFALARTWQAAGEKYLEIYRRVLDSSLLRSDSLEQ